MVGSAHQSRLKNVPVFHGLSDAERQELFGIAEELPVKKGDLVFQDGAPGDALFVVLEGQLSVEKKGQVLATIAEGGVLGEMSLMGGGGTRSASAVATVDTKVLKLSTERFQKMIQADHVAALKVVSNLAVVMCRRLLALNEKVVEVARAGRKDGELQDFQKILSNWSF